MLIGQRKYSSKEHWTGPESETRPIGKESYPALEDYVKFIIMFVKVSSLTVAEIHKQQENVVI